jgi:hypothetical protein
MDLRLQVSVCGEHTLTIVVTDKLFDYLCKCKDGQCTRALALPVRWNTQMQRLYDLLKTTNTFNIVLMNKSEDQTYPYNSRPHDALAGGWIIYNMKSSLDYIVNCTDSISSHFRCVPGWSMQKEDRLKRRFSRTKRVRHNDKRQEMIKEMYKDEDGDVTYAIIYLYPTWHNRHLLPNN